MNREEAIRLVNSVKDKCGLRNKNYNETNLLTLSNFILNTNFNEDEQDILIKFFNKAEHEKSLSTSLVDKIYDDNDIIDKLFRRKEIELEEGNIVKIGDKNIFLNENQLDEIYQKALEKDMSFESECIMNWDKIMTYEDIFIDDRTQMYIDEGEDEDEAEGMAEEDSYNVRNEADMYTSYLLDDEGSHYEYASDIKEASESQGRGCKIIFTVKDKLNNLFVNQKFSTINEPVINDGDIILKVRLFK